MKKILISYLNENKDENIWLGVIFVMDRNFENIQQL